MSENTQRYSSFENSLIVSALMAVSNEIHKGDNHHYTVKKRDNHKPTEHELRVQYALYGKKAEHDCLERYIREHPEQVAEGEGFSLELNQSLEKHEVAA